MSSFGTDTRALVPMGMAVVLCGTLCVWCQLDGQFPSLHSTVFVSGHETGQDFPAWSCSI